MLYNNIKFSNKCIFYMSSCCTSFENLGYMNKLTIVTTNMPFSRWGEVFSDNTLVSAVLDRLLHYSHIIRITGNSYRIKDKIVESDSRTNEYNE